MPYKAYLDADQSAPSGDDVDVFIWEIPREQPFATLIQATSTLTPGVASVAIQAGTAEFAIQEIAASFQVVLPPVEILSIGAAFGIWGSDLAAAYPDEAEGQGYWADSTGFVVTGDYNTYGISDWF